MAAGPRSADDDGTGCCNFFMLNADFVRKFQGTSLPFFHELRDKFIDNEPLVEVSLDYADVVKGTHVETTLAVSHRWMQPDDPDPDGEQLKALKSFLNSPNGKKIERVWIDSACMPQDHPKGSRSAKDSAAFKRMLKEVNRIYLGTTVLILLDLSYVSRFWTQFESWLAMQFAMPGGLKPAVGTKNERHRIVCIQNAAEQSELHQKMLIQSWATKTPQQAHAFLSKPDVTVTNQKDKEGQLPKIKALDATVQAAFSEIARGRQLDNERAAREAAAKRAEAWETLLAGPRGCCTRCWLPRLSFESSAKKVSIEQDGRRFRSTSSCLVFCSPPLEKMLVPRVRLRLLEAADDFTYVGAAPADVNSHNESCPFCGLGFAKDGAVRFTWATKKYSNKARAFGIGSEIELRYDAPKCIVQLWAKNDKGAFVMINEHGPIPQGCAFELLS